ncbi:unnamed protein product [Peniophora sp. CBMAI 1063]|nr:unnamed protein product [Peniophora sp. CBMAI 1063]
MEFSRTTNDASFAQPTDKFWSLYLAEVQTQDKQRIDRWKGDADGILIFTGLFAATVATFVVASYPNLSPDTGDETVALLSDIAALLSNGTRANALVTSSASQSAETGSQPSVTDVCVNALWFLSLIVAVFGAMLATLVQQWSRQYAQNTQRRGSPTVLGPIHLFISSGIDLFLMEDAIGIIVSLIHLAVSLFAVGLLIFLYSANHAIAWLAIAAVSIAAACYLLLSVLPLIYPESPYRTPFTTWLRLCIALVGLAHMTIKTFLTRVSCYFRDLRNSFRSAHLPTTYASASDSKKSLDFRFRFRFKVRNSFTEIKEVARSPTARQVLKAIDAVWQNADEADEIMMFCSAVKPMLSFPYKSERSNTDSEFQERSLSGLLLTKTDIITRVHWLIMSIKNLPPTVPEAERNARVVVGFRFLHDLLNNHVSSLGDQALEPQVVEAFTKLVIDLTTFIAPQPISSPSASDTYVSTFLLIRCFSYLFPGFRRSDMNTRTLEDYLEQNHPHAHAEELKGCKNFHKGGVSGFLPDTFQSFAFMGPVETKMGVPRVGRALDCAHCRVVSITTFVLDFGASSPGAAQAVIGLTHVWWPIVDSLCEETGITGPDYNRRVEPNHLSHYLIADLLNTMKVDSWRGPGRIDANSSHPSDFPWRVNNERYDHILLFSSQLRGVIRAFIHCFQESDIALMPIESIYKSLSPLGRAQNTPEDLATTVPSRSATLVSEKGRRATWSSFKPTLSLSRSTRTSSGSDPGEADMLSGSLKRLGASVDEPSMNASAPQSPDSKRTPPSSRRQSFSNKRYSIERRSTEQRRSPLASSTIASESSRAENSVDAALHLAHSPLAYTESYPSREATYAANWGDQHHRSQSPPATNSIDRIAPRALRIKPHVSIPPPVATATRPDYRSRRPASPGIDSLAYTSYTLRSLPETEWDEWDEMVRMGHTVPISPPDTTRVPASKVVAEGTEHSHEAPEINKPETTSEAPDTADSFVVEPSFSNGKAPQRNDSEDPEQGRQQMTRSQRLAFLSSPSRAASVENRAHAAVLEAAQSIQTVRFLEDDEDYTEEPRQVL